jgi:hypothetical protein
MNGQALAILACVIGMQSSARADELTRVESSRGMFGLEATIGVYSGIGGGVRVGDERFGVNVIAGWVPLLVATQDRESFGPETPEYNFHSTLQANADVYLLVSQPTRRSSIGVTAGYKGSTHLGHGVGLGFYAEIDAKLSISYFVMGGVMYFRKRAAEREGDISGRRGVHLPGPSLTSGINLGMVIAVAARAGRLLNARGAARAPETPRPESLADRMERGVDGS